MCYSKKNLCELKQLLNTLSYQFVLSAVVVFCLFLQPSYAGDSSLSESEISELNNKLQQASELFYRQQYHLALPLFEEISSKIDSIDVLYRLGRSALGSGKAKLAIEKFKMVLEQQPDLLPARIDLALAYLNDQQIENARWELQKITESTPPEELQASIDLIIDKINKADKRLFVSMRMSIGVQHNNNINSGPAQSEVEIVGGNKLSNLTQNRGGAHVTKISIDVLNDLGEKDNFLWRNSLSIYNEDYFDFSEYDYSQVEFRSSFESYKDRKRTKIPIGLKGKWYGDTELSDSFFFSPEFEYELKDNLHFITQYKYEHEKFSSQANKLQDSINQSVNFGPRWTFDAEMLHIYSLQGSFADKDADSDTSLTSEDMYSFVEWGISPYYFGKTKNNLEVFCMMRYADREYSGKPSGFLDRRYDKKYTVMTRLSQNLSDKFVLTGHATYVNNRSNVPLYKYDSFKIGVDLGVNFDFAK